MSVATGTGLASLTTLRVGGPARRLVTAGTTGDLVEAVRAADTAGERVLLVGGGSNLVVSDVGWDGTVILVRSAGVAREAAPGGAVRVRVAAGHDWDALVAEAVDDGLAGIEALSGIPGSTGATPVQNVGAYGQDVAATVAAVRVWDRRAGREEVWSPGDCAFAYRDSRFKRAASAGPGDTDRYLVLEVAFDLVPDGLSQPVRYAELARRLGVAVGERAPLAEVRAAVLDLRRGKGMVLDPDDRDTWSVGSFFTNPVVPDAVAEAVPGDPPRWPAGDGLVKLPAAWLIERAGVGRGHGLPGPVAVSTKHTLALTNRGGATAADVVSLAREVRAAVEAAFGIVLEPEPRLVGLSL
ncbi:MAG: UDP-N-acetylmuramate dehydrogenase [Kineosporiaceae bacterium]